MVLMMILEKEQEKCRKVRNLCTFAFTAKVMRSGEEEANESTSLHMCK